jgi:7-cyano-7-deazaguanine synthase in queuosine biosynthesis
MTFFQQMVKLANNPPPLIFWETFAEAVSAKEYPDVPPRVTGSIGNMFEAVVLVSGGMDSTIAYRRATQMHNQVRGLYVDFGMENNLGEMQALDNLGTNYAVVQLDLGYAGRSIEWRHILPARNLVMLEQAAILGGQDTTIWLGAVAGEIPDTGGDKSVKFLQLAFDSLIAHYRIRGIQTLSEMYKANWAKWWFDTQSDPETLLETVGCYEVPDGIHCGTCQACLRRFIALSLAGYNRIDILDNYRVDPLGGFGAREAIAKYTTIMPRELDGIEDYGYRMTRIRQTLTVLAPHELEKRSIPLWTWE